MLHVMNRTTQLLTPALTTMKVLVEHSAFQLLPYLV
jgi:hypothetical protein